MPEETKANDATAVANAQTAEPTAMTSEPTVDYKAKYEELQANYDANRTNLNKLQNKLRELETKATDISGLKTLIDEIRENQAITLDEIDRMKQGEQITEIEGVHTEHKISRLEQLKIKKKEEMAMAQAFNDLQEALAQAEIDPQDSELIEEVYKKSKSPQEALKNLPSFVSKRAKKLVQEQVKMELEKQKEVKKEEIKASGALAVGVSASSASTDNIPTNRKDLGAWINSLSSEEYKRLRPKIEEVREKLT